MSKMGMHTRKATTRNPESDPNVPGIETKAYGEIQSSGQSMRAYLKLPLS